MEYDTDNIIILGAGASYDAGIPLLGNFMQTMWEMSIRHTYNGHTIPEDDLNLIIKALKITREMDNYHGRINYNDKNIEEVMSLLSFKIKTGTRKDKTNLTTFTKAVARVIDITCSVKYEIPSQSYINLQKQSNAYTTFWSCMFKLFDSTGSIPVILTLNYDLVLERSLLNTLHSVNNHKFPFTCLLYTSPSPRDRTRSRMPSSA